ncbi:MAG: macro domain-containing protein [Elusimicrobiota bacterium]|jgi:O-acetyl-ADP-ribose deacetylase (regulator of RNase III)
MNASLADQNWFQKGLFAATGPELLAECRTLGGCPTGEAKITKGYRLPARYVIHAVGPRWRGGSSGEPEALASCYRKSLELAEAKGLRTLAFPAISCGIYGYPLEEAAQIAVREIRFFLSAHPSSFTKIYLVAFGADVQKVYNAQL